MKTETYLEVLMDAADLLPDYEKENLEKVMSKKCCKDDIYETGIGGRLGFLITEMKKEIYEYYTKHSGGGKMLSFAKKVIKRARRSGNESIHYVYANDGYSYFTDGAMAVKTRQTLKALEAPDGFKGNYSIYDIIGKTAHDIVKRLELPDPCKLKTLFKIEKAKFKVEFHPHGVDFRFFYDFGAGLPLIDGEKLIEIFDAIPDVELYLAKDGMIYGMSAKGPGEAELILCPVRRSKVEESDRAKMEHTMDDVNNAVSA